MSDYTKTTNFTTKDGLSSGDSNKLIKGVDFDTEFDDIVTAITSKYDSTDLASQAQAEALSSNVVLITPKTLNDVLAENGSMLQDIQALADPGSDRILGWDDSANAVISFTMTAPLQGSATAIKVATASATAEGVSELATDAETNTGSATNRVVTPANLAQATSLLQATASQKGAIEIATDAEANTGSATDRAITPANLAQATSLLQATASQKGAVELATQAEVDAGSDTARVITPATLLTQGVRKVKSADDTVTSSTTLIDDTHLVGWSLTTGKLYKIAGQLRYFQNVGNIKVKFDFSNAPAEVGMLHWQFESDSDDTLVRAGSVAIEQVASTMTDSDEVSVLIHAIFQANASTGGDVAFQFSQNTSSANGTILRTGSYLTITQLD